MEPIAPLLNLTNIPRLICEHILSTIPSQLIKISRVCKAWLAIVEEHYFWRFRHEKFLGWLGQPSDLQPFIPFRLLNNSWRCTYFFTEPKHVASFFRSDYCAPEELLHAFYQNSPLLIIALCGGKNKFYQLPYIQLTAEETHQGLTHTQMSAPIMRFVDSNGCYGLAFKVMATNQNEHIVTLAQRADHKWEFCQCEFFRKLRHMQLLQHFLEGATLPFDGQDTLKLMSE